MIGSLYTGASGVKTYSGAMTVTGSNIANVNTTGYKRTRANFEDILATSVQGAEQKIGKGVTIASIDTVHAQGTFENSELNTDMAVDGDGFFIAKDKFGKEYFTRDGKFKYDKEGYLTNTRGKYIQVKMVDGVENKSVGPLTKIKLMNVVDNPKPTGTGSTKGTGIQVSANINSEAKEPSLPFNKDNVKGEMYNFSTSVTVHDALGKKHVVTMAFRKKTDLPLQIDPATNQPVPGTGVKNRWEWYSIVPGADIEGGGSGAKMQAVGGGFLQFSDDGRLLEATQGDFVQPALAAPGAQPGLAQLVDQGVVNDGRPQATTRFVGMDTEQTIGFDFGLGSNPNDLADKRTGLDGVTQFASGNKVISLNADGNESGVLQDFSIDDTGLIMGQFDSGVTRGIARVQLGKFASESSLQRVGDNLFIESYKSGKPVVGDPGGGGLGNVRGKTLEKSNVDLANQFVKMIENQRAFQANAKTVTTSDEMVSELVNMKR